LDLVRVLDAAGEAARAAVGDARGAGEE